MGTTLLVILHSCYTHEDSLDHATLHLCYKI